MDSLIYLTFGKNVGNTVKIEILYPDIISLNFLWKSYILTWELTGLKTTVSSAPAKQSCQDI